MTQIKENNRKPHSDKRKIERRAPKRGVTIRHDDDWYIPKRIRNANPDRPRFGNEK